MKMHLNILTKSVFVIVCILSINTVSADDELPETTFDGLVRVKDSTVDMSFVLPGSDLSGYNKVMILRAHIAFRKNWQRDQNQSITGGRRVSDEDMARIIGRGEVLFGQAFIDVLEENGYPVVSSAGSDVLLVRPAIINLDIAEPQTQSASRTRTFSANSTRATLFIELSDSVTGQILVRASDEKATRSDSVRWSMARSSVSSSDDATKAFRYWAKLLVDALNDAKENAVE